MYQKRACLLKNPGNHIAQGEKKMAHQEQRDPDWSEDDHSVRKCRLKVKVHEKREVAIEGKIPGEEAIYRMHKGGL